MPSLLQETCSVELALQLAGFKNVDLFSQGVYQLRLSVRGAQSGRVALPFDISLPSAAEANAHVPPELAAKEFALPAHVLEESGECCTPAFRIRFCEEEVVLRHIFRLRLELDLLQPHEGATADVCEPLLLQVYAQAPTPAIRPALVSLRLTPSLSLSLSLSRPSRPPRSVSCG